MASSLEKRYKELEENLIDPKNNLYIDGLLVRFISARMFIENELFTYKFQ